MKLTVMGFGILGMFMMGCGLLEPATPVGQATMTSATVTDSTPADALLPRSRPSIKADMTDPWDGSEIVLPSLKLDKADPWAPPAEAAVAPAAAPASN
jgi:hypothetical protein